MLVYKRMLNASQFSRLEHSIGTYIDVYMYKFDKGKVDTHFPTIDCENESKTIFP